MSAPTGSRRWRLPLRVAVLFYLTLLVLLPVGTVFYRAFQHGLGSAWDAITAPDALHALWLTLLVAAIAVPLNTIFGVGVSIILARHRFPGAWLLDALVDIPLAISPVVIGLSLILVYGHTGWFGNWLAARGITVIFSLPGIIMASAAVSLPYVVREVLPVLQEMGTEQEQAASTLGARPLTVFRRITLPGIRRGLAYGVTLTTARVLGEFGAVAIVSGAIAGKTEIVLLNLGYKISGSDFRQSAVTARLVSMGAAIAEGHRAENIAGAEVVIVSSAIARDNPEIVAAHAQHIPVIQRAEMLAELMRLKYGIAIAGMHGKTTTTSMVAAVLAGGGLDPTVVVGGRVDAMGSNARLGKSQYLVAEADESDRSFLKLSPILSVVTNIDREHMDCYRDMQDVEETFLKFMDSVPFYGAVIACNDNDDLRRLLSGVQRRVLTYGLRDDSDFRVSSLQCGRGDASGKLSRFQVAYRGQQLGAFELQVPGAHNVSNATAAIAVGVGLDVPLEDIRRALAGFSGVDRRFQVIGSADGVTVIDDYGHHPTEIRATLAAARQCGFAEIHVIFQPHRYSRTQLLLDDFATAFRDADSVLILDIYAASEKPIPGINAELLANRITEAGGQEALYVRSFEEAGELACRAAKSGDMILTLGAGSIWQLGPQVLERLTRKSMV